MHIVVCVKQTPDSNSVYIDPITGRVDEDRFVRVINPADACAVEAAVSIKEQLGGSVFVLTLGPEDAESVLRAALAMGADRALRLWGAPAANWEPYQVARALAVGIQSAFPFSDLILCGDASSDWSTGIVGPAIAEVLDLPQVTGVVRLAIAQEMEQLTIQVTRRLERGYRELLAAYPPLLLTVSSDLNEPRYPSLPAHIAALKASIPVIDTRTLLGNTQIEEAEETSLHEVHTPRPLPRRVPTPDSRHSAFERIGEIIAGGTTGRKTRLVEGTPRELAQELVAFLREKGFL